MVSGVLQHVTRHGVNTAGNLGKYTSCPPAMIASCCHHPRVIMSVRCSALLASTLLMRAVHFKIVRLEIHDSHGFNPMCLSCQTCILCAPALPPVSVMRAAFVVVLVPACNPVACCTCFCRRHVPALASAFVLRLLVSSSLYAVLPGTCLPLPARRGIRLYVSWVLHGDAIVPRLRRCWRLGESNYPYSPLAIPSQVNT